MSGEVEFRPLDCEAVVRELWAYLDGEVKPEREALLADHLSRCASCRGHEAFERRLLGELARVRRTHSDPDGLRARVLSVLRTAGMDREAPERDG